VTFSHGSNLITAVNISLNNQKHPKRFGSLALINNPRDGRIKIPYAGRGTGYNDEERRTRPQGDKPGSANYGIKKNFILRTKLLATRKSLTGKIDIKSS
jgi:hypothetical protein